MSLKIPNLLHKMLCGTQTGSQGDLSPACESQIHVHGILLRCPMLVLMAVLAPACAASGAPAAPAPEKQQPCPQPGVQCPVSSPAGSHSAHPT